jgi:hypothetical protein
MERAIEIFAGTNFLIIGLSHLALASLTFVHSVHKLRS